MTQATGSSFFTQAMALATANTTSTALPELLAFMTSRLGQQRANALVQKVGHLLTLEQEYALKETYLYGSSRLGVKNQNTILSTRVASVQNGSLTPIGNAILNNDSVFTGTASAYNLPKAPSSRVFYRTWGLKQYELSNHLGNVQVTISDKKIGVVGANQEDFIAYEPEVKSATDYYAYGMEMPGKTYQSSNYRYGMQGHEKLNELNGSNNDYDFGARIYSSRLGIFLGVDPMFAKYPYSSPFSSFNGNPLLFVDPNGKEWVNVYDEEVKKLEASLTKNPTDKGIIAKLETAKENQRKVNELLVEFKKNDEKLYNYIDNLQVTNLETNSKENVKVFLSLGDMTESKNGEEAKTVYDNSKTIVQYNSQEGFNNNEAKAPIFNGQIGFGIRILQPRFMDVSLANEAGDVMYRMEFPFRAIDGGSDEGKSYEDYKKKNSAGDYSERVQDNYKKNKKDKSGQNYPLKLREER